MKAAPIYRWTVRDVRTGVLLRTWAKPAKKTEDLLEQLEKAGANSGVIRYVEKQSIPRKILWETNRTRTTVVRES